MKKTTYYFIRHAEKEWDGTYDPPLSELGRKRAEHWAEFLTNKGIEKVYCTKLIRTQQTAQVLMDRLSLDFEVYNPNDFYVEKFKEETRGKTVLIVGHQDATPNLVNILVGKRKYKYIESSNFSNFYEVIINENGEISDRLKQVDF